MGVCSDQSTETWVDSIHSELRALFPKVTMSLLKFAVVLVICAVACAANEGEALEDDALLKNSQAATESEGKEKGWGYGYGYGYPAYGYSHLGYAGHLGYGYGAYHPYTYGYPAYGYGHHGYYGY